MITSSSPAAALQWQNLPAAQGFADPALRSDWDLLNRSRGDLPILASTTLACALQCFGDGHERLLVGRQRDGAVQAMLILERAGRLGWRTFQASQLPLGTWVAAPGHDPADIARMLLHRDLGFSMVLALTQIDPRYTPRGDDAADSLVLDYVDTGWIELAGSFDGYWAGRGKNLRQNMRKQRNRLVADGTVATMRSLTAAADMAAAVARYGELESRGWKAADGKAIHPDNDQGRYYTALFTDAAQRGEALVYEYLFDERTVAMDLCLRRDGVLIVLKTTYDESIRNLSPAFMLREEELQALYAEGRIQRLEFYGRMMEWHTRWTDTSCKLYHVSVYRWPALKQLARQWGDRKRRLAAAAESAPAETAAAAPVTP